MVDTPFLKSVLSSLRADRRSACSHNWSNPDPIKRLQITIRCVALAPEACTYLDPSPEKESARQLSSQVTRCR
jgi:hypothetical protein